MLIALRKAPRPPPPEIEEDSDPEIAELQVRGCFRSLFFGQPCQAQLAAAKSKKVEISQRRESVRVKSEDPGSASSKSRTRSWSIDSDIVDVTEEFRKKKRRRLAGGDVIDLT